MIAGTNHGKATPTSATAGQLVAVVVTYQRLAKLQSTLSRLLAADPRHLSHIVVVDNASDDGTGDWLACQTDPRLIVHTLAQNMGGAGGFEAGLRFSMENLDPDWLLLTDDDSRPMEEALARFHAVPRGNREAWAAAVYYPSGKLCELNRPTLNPFWNWRTFFGALFSGRKGFHVTDDDFAGSRTRPIDATSFVGFFLSRKAVQLVGYPDPNLFIYGDDVLYTLGLRRSGGTIEFDPTLRFEHDCESSRPGRKIYDPVWRAYYHHRNIILVYRRAAGPFFWLVMPLILATWMTLPREYGENAQEFRALLRRAIRDGLNNDRSATLLEIQALAKPARPHPDPCRTIPG